MLDLFAIFTKGGIVLWSYKEGTVSGNPISDLVRSILIEEHSGDKAVHTFKTHGVQYELDNEFNLVFAVSLKSIVNYTAYLTADQAVYLKQLESHLKYIPGLLKKVHSTFVKEFKSKLLENPFQDYKSFEAAFQILRKSEQQKAKEETVSMKSFEESKKFQTTLQHNTELQSGEKKVKDAEKQKKTDEAQQKEKDEEADEARRIKEVLAKRGKRGGRVVKKNVKPSSAPSSTSTTPKKKKPPSEKVRIDYSDPSQKEPDISDYVPNMGDYVKTEDGEVAQMDYDSDNSWEVVDEEEAGGKESGPTGGVFSFFKGLTGQSVISKESLEPVLEKMKEHLISKNVASEIAGKLCESVGQSLEGRSKGTFSGVASIVKESVQETLTRILSPNRRLDILRDIMAANDKGSPYSVVFCGVNGVGKSTNLAKICFWLMENNNRVLIAACDTFRAGAVEQLKTHCKKLNAIHKPKDGEEPRAVLYEKGYGKDDAGIAKDAITFAKDNGFDVVLVDTAGRMQGNERLMRSLAKLVKVNDPNLVLFVGEALVGNEAVDQLSKFNQALGDYSESNTPRLIDGVVLTKFDTIDDKVGAAISMTYTCGQPIVFVGTGQEYHDLKKLNVKSVVQALLK